MMPQKVEDLTPATVKIDVVSTNSKLRKVCLKSKPTSQNINTNLNYKEVMTLATKSGFAGAFAMCTNIITLMWTRTIVNYQYRYGCGYASAIHTLYKDGGIRRFYRGMSFAIIQGPLARFGETAANTGTLVLLNNHESAKHLDIGIKTSIAMSIASLWRVIIMPIDTCKTTLQVTGSIKPCITKMRTNGFSTMYHGSTAMYTASFVGHFPWFFTYNYLYEYIPKREEHSVYQEITRKGFIGFVASVISDITSNSIRVVKVYKQTHVDSISYPAIVRKIIGESGVWSLFVRGLETRILSNGIQGILFSIIWKSGEEIMSSK